MREQRSCHHHRRRSPRLARHRPPGVAWPGQPGCRDGPAPRSWQGPAV